MTAITLITDSGCGLCDHAKAVLARVNEEYPLTVREIALSSEEGRHLARDAGVMFPPGVIIDGQLFAHGRVSEKKLRRHLAAVPAAGRSPHDS